MSLPSIVLIPGAWHVPEHYAPLLDRFRNAKFEVVSRRLPSVGSETPREQSVAKDVEFIKNTLLFPLIDAGKDILFIMHSYGGCPGGDAAKGLSKAERKAAGKEGGIIGLVYMCAFVASEGDSVLSKVPGQRYSPYIVHNESIAELRVNNPKEIFYNLVDEAAAQKAVSLLMTHAAPAFSTPSGPPAWPDSVYDGKRAFIQTEQDNSFPFVAQEGLLAYTGVAWDVLKLNAGHSPFLSHPQELADFLIAKANKYAE